MITLILIRHGRTHYNDDRRYSGQLDVPMTSQGLLQVQGTSKYVIENFKVDSVYSSDLSRAYDTVLPIAKHFGLPVTTLRDLRETDVGDWHDAYYDDLIVKYPELMVQYHNEPGAFRFPNGEDSTDVQKRALRAIETIVKENEGKTVAIGSHGGLIRALCAAWLGLSTEQYSSAPHIYNASVTVAKYENGKVEILQAGYDDHLKEINAQAESNPVL